MNTSSKPRFEFLDAFRGLLVISMVIYHFFWDLVFIKGTDWPWYRDYTTPTRLWQVFMRFFFIFLSGYCLNLSKRSLRRGLELTACGALITLVTLLIMPEDIIIFGVLTFLGAATLIGTPVRQKYNGGTVTSAALFLVCALLYIVFRGISLGYVGFMFHPLIILPAGLYRGYFMTFLGFNDPGFWSTDYVPLLPWIFTYFMGFFLGRITLPYLTEKKLNADARSRSFLPDFITEPLIWTGRHALIIYMVHQPILAGITYLLIYLGR